MPDKLGDMLQPCMLLLPILFVKFCPTAVRFENPCPKPSLNLDDRDKFVDKWGPPNPGERVGILGVSPGGKTCCDT